MFRTEIEKLDIDFRIDHSKPLISIGSCFSDTIGHRFEKAKFSIIVNPFGTVFNPISIFNLLRHTARLDSLNEQNIIQRDGLFLSHDLHSSFRAGSKKELIEKFDEIKEKVHAQLQKTEVLFITFGTSWVYEQKRDGSLVSNCHKVPQQHFNKRLLQVDEIISDFFSLKELLETVNRNLKFVLTVSPVRHTRERLQGNSISKSNLRLACHYLEEMADGVYYFPSYEMMIDDLRDYRFYGSDFIHPNDQAIAYIWQKFQESFLSKKALDDIAELAQVQNALEHKAFNPQAKAHQKFLLKTLEKAEQLNKKIGLKEEIKRLKSEIIHD